MSAGGRVCYLYCLTPGGCGARPAEPGVDGESPIQISTCGRTNVVFSDVALDEFCGERAEAHLQDLEWLGPRACRHEAIIESVMGDKPVLPVPFATLFSSLDRLHEVVAEHQETIAGYFGRVKGKQEWAVKGVLMRDVACQQLTMAALSADDSPAAAVSAGVRYLQMKRVRALVEKDLNTRLKQFAQRAAHILNLLADGFRERKVPVANIDQPGAEVVFNWAFLVPVSALEDFRARIEQLNGSEGFPGLMLALSGPWPPYSFAPELSSGEKA